MNSVRSAIKNRCVNVNRDRRSKYFSCKAHSLIQCNFRRIKFYPIFQFIPNYEFLLCAVRIITFEYIVRPAWCSNFQSHQFLYIWFEQIGRPLTPSANARMFICCVCVCMCGDTYEYKWLTTYPRSKASFNSTWVTVVVNPRSDTWWWHSSSFKLAW